MDPVNQVIAYTAEHGGGTFEQGTFLPFEPKSGYAVAIGGARVSAEADLQVVRMLLHVVPQEYEASFVGTWLEGGTLFIDAVRYFAADRREAALLAGYQAGQQAIYDFAAGESIYLGEELPA